MPGLIDTHIHAPQYAVTGTGYGQEVVEWLKTYIHPIEAKFKDLAFARNVSRKAVVGNFVFLCFFFYDVLN